MARDQALFFPPVGMNAAKAKALCAICPVRQPCLEYAAGDAEIGGIWGGLTERERRKLRVVGVAGPDSLAMVGQFT